MRVIVVGNGLAGTIFAKSLRELNPDVKIDIFGEEGYLYYPRPNLIEFLAGNIEYGQLFAYPEDWYQERHLEIHLGKRVDKVIPGSLEVELQDGRREKFDKLILTDGARASVPPIKGSDKKGVFTLRTLDNALDILDHLEKLQKLAVIGGGLLGLEIARAMISKGVDVDIVEFFPYLLGRQLDPQGASILKDQIEKMGIRVHLDSATEEIFGKNEAKGLRLKSGKRIDADMVIVAAGVRSNVDLAKEAGLEVNRGVVVNDLLQTSDTNIYAAGDNVEHKGRSYGIIPASFQQSRTAAFNVAGQEQAYEGTTPSNTLKVVGLHVTSIGLVSPEEGTGEEFRKADLEAGLYKKIVVQDGIVVAAIWMGTKQGVNEINRIVAHRTNVDRWKAALVEDDFDYSVI